MTDGIINGKKQPTVITLQTTLLDEGIFLWEGEISSIGKGETILSKGFYWSETNPNPLENDNVIELGPTQSSFSTELKNIAGGKTFYWRAFAENEFGYDLGKVISYSTPVVWKQRADFIAPIRGFFSSCILNDEIFIFGGQKSTGSIVLNETWIYNITTDTWRSNRVDFEGIRRYPASFSIGGNIYVGTGQRTSVNLYNDFYRMNGDTYSWSSVEIEENLESRYDAGNFNLKGKGYIVGGTRANYPYYLSDVWSFDSTSEKWTRLNNFPKSFSGGISFSDDNRAFVGFGVTGDNGNSTEKELWEYNTTTDSWEIISSLPDDFSAKIIGGAMLRNVIYIANSNLEIWQLNLNSLEWSLKGHIPEILKIETDEVKFLMLAHNNSIFIGLNFTEYLFEYLPLWDNE